MMSKRWAVFWTFLITIDGLGLARSNSCGYLPQEIYLKRGERKQLIFWTDQDYTNTENPQDGLSDSNVDVFLQAVNGVVTIGPQDTQEDESGPQFITPLTTTVSSTTSTSAPTTKRTEEYTEEPFIEETTFLAEFVAEATTTVLPESESSTDEVTTQSPTSEVSAVQPDHEPVVNIEPATFAAQPQENEVLTVIIGETEHVTDAPVKENVSEPTEEVQTTTEMIANEVEPEMTTIEAIPEVTTSVAEPEITEKAETSSHFESDDQQESALNEGENLSVLSTIELGDENSFISVLDTQHNFQGSDDSESMKDINEPQDESFHFDPPESLKADPQLNELEHDEKLPENDTEVQSNNSNEIEASQKPTEEIDILLKPANTEDHLDVATTTEIPEPETTTFEEITPRNNLFIHQKLENVEETTFEALNQPETTTVFEAENEVSTSLNPQVYNLEVAIEQTTIEHELTSVKYEEELLTTERVVPLSYISLDDEATTEIQPVEGYNQKITVDTFDIDGQVELKKVSNKNIFEELKNTIAAVAPRQPEIYSLNNEETTMKSLDEITTSPGELITYKIPNLNLNNIVFEETTIAFPDSGPDSGNPVPIIEAVVAEDENPSVGITEFDETTIAFPIETETSSSTGAGLTDEHGLLIDTTTGYSINLNKVSLVHEAVRKSGLHPAKHTPGYILDELQNGLNTVDDEKMGTQTETTTIEEDQTTTLLPELNNEVLSSKNSTSDETNDEESGGVAFPMEDLLNGIYRFVSSYIKPKPTDAQNKLERNEEAFDDEPLDDEDEDDFTVIAPKQTIIGPQPLNSYITPRDQLIVEAVDVEHSNSDPFFQMPAPNLKESAPIEHLSEAIEAENAILFPKPNKVEPARTLSPFNSPALIVQDPPKIEKLDLSAGLAAPLPLTAPIQRSGLPATHSHEQFSESDNSAPPLSFFPRGQNEQRRPISPVQHKQPPQPFGPSNKGRLTLGNVAQPSRDPVFIPIPGANNNERALRRHSVDHDEIDPIGSIKNAGRKFIGFLDSLPIPMKNSFLRKERQKREVEEHLESSETTTESPNGIHCNWNIKTESGFYLLITFHNLSAPFTVDCKGAYIEVERENNGFEARWCGNRVTKGGSRPHVIFAKNEVRITVFDDGNQDNELPTGFAADVEVIDLFDGQQYSDLRKTNAYSNVKKHIG